MKRNPWLILAALFALALSFSINTPAHASKVKPAISCGYSEISQAWANLNVSGKTFTLYSRLDADFDGLHNWCGHYRAYGSISGPALYPTPGDILDVELGDGAFLKARCTATIYANSQSTFADCTTNGASPTNLSDTMNSNTFTQAYYNLAAAVSYGKV